MYCVYLQANTGFVGTAIGDWHTGIPHLVPTHYCSACKVHALYAYDVSYGRGLPGGAALTVGNEPGPVRHPTHPSCAFLQTYKNP